MCSTTNQHLLETYLMLLSYGNCVYKAINKNIYFNMSSTSKCLIIQIHKEIITINYCYLNTIFYYDH